MMLVVKDQRSVSATDSGIKPAEQLVCILCIDYSRWCEPRVRQRACNVPCGRMREGRPRAWEKVAEMQLRIQEASGWAALNDRSEGGDGLRP